jgi:hypothetical protein
MCIYTVSDCATFAQPVNACKYVAKLKLLYSPDHEDTVGRDMPDRTFSFRGFSAEPQRD